MVGLDAQTLEHAHVEIAEGRRVLRIEMEVLAVLEAAAGEEDGEIFRGVAAGVAEIAAEENGGAVEEVGVVFLWSTRGLVNKRTDLNGTKIKRVVDE
jgi:hypothetical protein